MDILWTKHARFKINVLREHGFIIRENLIQEFLKGHLVKVEIQRTGEKIAQMQLDEDHVLRVVFGETAEARRIITLYPGQRERYEA